MGVVWTGTPPFGRPVPGWLGMFRGGVAGGPQRVADWVDAQGHGLAVPGPFPLGYDRCRPKPEKRKRRKVK